MKGTLIALEGIDASGKATQARMLARFLEARGVAVEFITFPQYESHLFGRLTGEYLDGKYGDMKTAHPLFAAVLFAGDRFQSRDRICAWLDEGKVVIADRYVGSNLAHQSARLPADERKQFIQRIEKIEYEIYGLPREDLVLYLNINPEISQELVLKKAERSYTKKKKDIHEENPLYLSDVAYRYRWLAENRGHWQVVECVDEAGAMKSKQAIHESIIDTINSHLHINIYDV